MEAYGSQKNNFFQELTPLPLSATQRGGVRRCMIEPSPSLQGGVYRSGPGG